MVNMRDVARLAGVSAPTVSYVINNGPRPVSEETRARVQRAIKELGYKPNTLARGLARKATLSIAFIVPDISDLFFARLAHAVEEVAYSSGFSLFLCNTERDLRREISYFSLLAEKRVDGVLLISCGISSEQLRRCISEDLPLVVLDREIKGATADTVLFDTFAAGKQATEHMIKHGYNRIACLAGPKPLIGAVQRVEGYRAALEEHGIAPDNELIRWSDYTFKDGLGVAGEMLRESRKFQAIVACNDEMGVSAIHAARRLGMRVPEDMAVIGIGDSFIGQTVIPQLTTISGSVDEMGHLGTELLLDRVRGVASWTQKHIVLETTPVIRESCGCGRSAGVERPAAKKFRARIDQ